MNLLDIIYYVIYYGYVEHVIFRPCEIICEIIRTLNTIESSLRISPSLPSHHHIKRHNFSSYLTTRPLLPIKLSRKRESNLVKASLSDARRTHSRRGVRSRGGSDAIRREHKSRSLAHFLVAPVDRRIQINRRNGRLRI